MTRKHVTYWTDKDLSPLKFKSYEHERYADQYSLFKVLSDEEDSEVTKFITPHTGGDLTPNHRAGLRKTIDKLVAFAKKIGVPNATGKITFSS